MRTTGKVVAVLGLCSALLLTAVACADGSDQAADDGCEGSVPLSGCTRELPAPGSARIELATEIAHRYMDEHPATKEAFDWRSGVLMFALSELYQVTGDARLRAYYQAYLDHHIEVGYEVVWSDACPPALPALALLADGEGLPYEQVVADVLDYLHAAPRTEAGGISHLGTALHPPASIWVDSLFMFGMVLNRYGEAFDDAAALDLMAEQLEIFADQLQDSSGLLVHAQGWPAPVDSDVFWARGNGWAIAAVADYLRIRGARGEEDPRALRMLEEQVAGILETQDEASGMWWTVMNRPGAPGNYLETSATALFAYGLARAHRSGLVGEEGLVAAEQAVEAVEAAVARDEQGRPYVTRISDGTLPTTYDGYVQVPVGDDLDHGVGAVILALVENPGT